MADGGHPAEDYLRPKLQALISDGVRAGFPQDEVIAVLISLLDEGPEEDGEMT
ncbi:hypothetical protein JK202_12595 [Gluconobacter sp. Dm-62]|uniref:hypothetical protein n=1 Tax=Gluconobacter sp. Dm-62 TaxID=2799804 RepID=UPI001B8D5CF9|nr:hypothetical protein [Gluconobacter sp. Dm-62]MBS1103841.1 hypothetical protein [Gluconobacter sp. Dm-62]